MVPVGNSRPREDLMATQEQVDHYTGLLAEVKQSDRDQKKISQAQYEMMEALGTMELIQDSIDKNPFLGAKTRDAFAAGLRILQGVEGALYMSVKSHDAISTDDYFCG